MKATLYVILAIFLGLQLIPAKIDNPKTDKNLEIKVSPEIMTIFKRSCYDCHSNEVVIPWYQNIAPGSFFYQETCRLREKMA